MVYIFTNTTTESSHLSSHRFILLKIHSNRLLSCESHRNSFTLSERKTRLITTTTTKTFVLRLLRYLTLLTVILTVSNGEHSHAVNHETLSFILGYTLEEKPTCVGVNLCCLRRKVQFKFCLTALFILQFLPRWVFIILRFQPAQRAHLLVVWGIATIRNKYCKSDISDTNY